MRRPPLGPAWWLLVCCAGVSIAIMVLADGLRLGGYLLAGTMALGALIRLILPTTMAGGVAVRSRPRDVILYLSLAGSLAVLFTLLKI